MLLRAAREPVKVSPGLFALLEHAKRLHDETAGAFDITIAPLVRCWGFMDGGGRVPADDELAAARAVVGLQFVRLDAHEFTVRFEHDGRVRELRCDFIAGCDGYHGVCRPSVSPAGHSPCNRVLRRTRA